MVFQEDTVFPWMRVQENVEFGLAPKESAAATTRRSRAADGWRPSASQVRREPAQELSGGMRKRVAIAAVFAGGARSC